MSTEYQDSNGETCVLLKTSSDGTEVRFISGLLESYGIEVYVHSPSVTAVTAAIDGPVAKYDIFVKTRSLADAKRLLEAPNLYGEHEYEGHERYKKRSQESGAWWGRVIAAISAAVCLALSSLPVKESDRSMRYVLIGVSLFFVLVLIASFYRGPANRQR